MLFRSWKYHRGTFNITLGLYEYNYKYDTKSYRHIGFILENFAHELAHLVEFNHSSAHMKLTGKILHKFGSVLKRQKIENTETTLDDFLRGLNERN